MPAIVCPVWVTNGDLMVTALRAFSTWDGGPGWEAILVANRLHEWTPDEFREKVREVCPIPATLLHEDGVSRSVAGAWNHGVYEAEGRGHDRVVIAAQDTDWRPGSLRTLVETAAARPDLWFLSGTDERVARGAEVTEGCDFSGVTFSLKAFHRIGGFDPGYQPAYYEDNDAAARVWHHGGDLGHCHAATFFHHGSATIKQCGLAAHHVRHWSDHNRDRFRGIWGSDPVGTRAEAVHRYRHIPAERSEL